MQEKLEYLATVETWDNGKPIRETMAADPPLAIDHFRYFSGCVRTQEGSIGQIDDDTVAYHYQQTKNLLVSYSPKALGFF